MRKIKNILQLVFAFTVFLNAAPSQAQSSNAEVHSSEIFDRASIESVYLKGVERIQQGNCEAASRYLEETIRQSARTINFYDAAINAYTGRSREDQIALTQAIRSVESSFGNYVVDLGFDRTSILSISNRSGLYLAECYIENRRYEEAIDLLNSYLSSVRVRDGITTHERGQPELWLQGINLLLSIPQTVAVD